MKNACQIVTGSTAGVDILVTIDAIKLMYRPFFRAKKRAKVVCPQTICNCRNQCYRAHERLILDCISNETHRQNGRTSNKLGCNACLSLGSHVWAYSRTCFRLRIQLAHCKSTIVCQQFVPDVSSQFIRGSSSAAKAQFFSQANWENRNQLTRRCDNFRIHIWGGKGG